MWVKHIKNDLLKSLRSFAIAGLHSSDILENEHVQEGIKNIIKRLFYYRRIAKGQSSQLALEWLNQVEEETNPEWITTAEKRAAAILKSTNPKKTSDF